MVLPLFPFPLSPALAQFNLRIVSVEFDSQFNPGEAVTFRVVVQNNEATAQFAEVDITLTRIGTSVEITLTPVLTVTVPAGDRSILTATYSTVDEEAPSASGARTTIPKGLYTVSFPLFDGNGDRSDNVVGRFPLQVGTEAESLRVFPEVAHLGTLPPGRFMHPVPVEVRFSFFRFNRLRSQHPFNIRIYTDNAARFNGIPGALRRPAMGGLLSDDGRYVIPLKIWSLNFGPDIQGTGWDVALAGPPPVEEDTYWRGPRLLTGERNPNAASWVRVPDLAEMTANPLSWRRLIGQDPFDSRFVSDSNRTGDFTLKSPFTFYLATEAGPTAVEGHYSTELIVELWAP